MKETASCPRGSTARSAARMPGLPRRSSVRLSAASEATSYPATGCPGRPRNSAEPDALSRLWLPARRSRVPASAASHDAGLTRDRRTVAEAGNQLTGSAAKRIAVISMHTSPTASLGQNANGGLNVYVREVATAFSDRGMATDIFTRRQSPDDPDVERLADLSRVIYLPAGRGLDKYTLFDEVPFFARRVEEFAIREGIDYDLLFSHYWLSGEVACLLRPRLAAGWAHVAHTLGLVKNRTLAAGARPEPVQRIRVEAEIAQQADLLVTSTEDESADLVNLYGADP